MKRAIVIKFTDGTEKELVLSKAAQIHSLNCGTLNLDQLKDGTWRLIWSNGLIDDFTKVKGFEIRRED
jgi:hypothetical protein